MISLAERINIDSHKKVIVKLSTPGVSPEIVRHSYEGRKPENAVPSELDASLRGHDMKNTPIPE